MGCEEAEIDDHMGYEEAKIDDTMGMTLWDVKKQEVDDFIWDVKKQR